MLASSRRSKQKFRGRGHAGAHKLIPMPTKTSCAQNEKTADMHPRL